MITDNYVSLLTELEVLEDTIEYYKSNPRAINSFDGCVYRNKDGNMCAVGRWIDWDKVKEEGFTDDFINDLGSVGSSNIVLKYLKEEVKHLPFGFWDDLQNYHDIILNDTDKNRIANKERDLVNRYYNK